MLRTFAVLAFGGLMAHAALAQQAAPVQQSSDSRLWYEAYDEGVRQVEQGNYQAGITSLQSAISKEPGQARRRAFYGGRVDAYIPDYYLGVAHLGLGNFDEADAAFQRARAAGLVAPGDPQYAQFETQASRASAEVSSRQAAQVAQQTPPPAAVQPPTVTAGDAGADPPRVPNPVDPAVNGRAGGEGLDAVLNPNPSPPLPGGSPGVEAVRGPVRGPIEVPPPFVDERLAIAAFFRGDYREAASALTAVVDRDGNVATARAHLYLASSLAALVVTEGTDDGRMETARLHLADAGAANALQEDRRLISPRLLALLESSR